VLREIIRAFRRVNLPPIERQEHVEIVERETVADGTVKVSRTIIHRERKSASVQISFRGRPRPAQLSTATRHCVTVLMLMRA
jgi:hypothetical protein